MNKKYIFTTFALALAVGAVFAQEQVINLPQAIPDAVDWLLASKTISVVKYTAAITFVTQVVKALVASFGGKMSPRVTTGLVGLSGLLTLVEQSITDGTIGGTSWSALVVSLIATLAAFFGYKVLFSKDARIQRERITLPVPGEDID